MDMDNIERMIEEAFKQAQKKGNADEMKAKERERKEREAKIAEIIRRVK